MALDVVVGPNKLITVINRLNPKLKPITAMPQQTNLSHPVSQLAKRPFFSPNYPA